MLSRRQVLALVAAGMSFPAGALAAGKPRVPGGAALEFGEPEPFSWQMLVERARRLRDEPFVPKENPAPGVLARIGYDQHNAIYQPARSGMFAEKGPDGVVTAFHLGELFRRPIRLHRVEDGTARELLYREAYFSYPEGSPAADMPDGAGFAGFRVHGPPWYENSEPGDWLVFLGASYFRSSGDLRQYGISARGLALDTAAPDGGKEEFPAFTEFWISPMEGGSMTIHALLEGPSVTGAYRFDVTHHPHVAMDTTCRVFLRGDVGRFGAAPLTSMYWYSQEKRWVPGDWRPEVHDSDGLLVRRGDDTPLWRPLTNPPRVSVTSFPFAKGGGFGLMQRDRNYDHYQDRAAFERRPNLWVEPVEGFEDGEIQLVELPTNAEYGDNMVAFFVPSRPAEAGADFAFRYTLHWSGEEPESHLARLVDVRLGRPRAYEDAAVPRLERKVIVDFAGGGLAGAEAENQAVRIDLNRGTAFKPWLSPAEQRPDGWRLEFDLFSRGPEPIDVTITLHDGERPLSETAILRIWPEMDLPG